MEGLIGFGYSLLTMLRDVMPIAAILFLWFIVALRGWIRSTQQRRNMLISDLQLVSGVVFVTLFLAFNVFAITMILQYGKIGRWRDYLVGEKTYMVMSLVAKTLLAWQVFAGTLAP